MMARPTRPHRFALVLLALGLSLLLGRSARDQRSFTGTVRDWRAGESITIVSPQTDPAGFTARLRHTQFEGASAPTAGASVTIWYRMVGESRPVADRVRVNPAPAS